MTSVAPPSPRPVTTADRDVPHPQLTADDRAAVGSAVRRYTVATGVALAGIFVGAGLVAAVPVAGAALLVLSFFTGVVAFSRRLELTHPRPGTRFRGKPLTLRVNPVAASAYTRWLEHGADEDESSERQVVERMVELAELTDAGRGDCQHARALTGRLVRDVRAATADGRAA